MENFDVINMTLLKILSLLELETVGGKQEKGELI